MKFEDFILGLIAGLISSLSVLIFYQNFFHKETTVFVVDFNKLKKEGFTKEQIISAIPRGVILIDRKCVLNPHGRDITKRIEEILKNSTFNSLSIEQ